jgi:siroheme synthase-like protein
MAEAAAPRSPKPWYPVSLDVQGRRCLVVGGGPVAARKAQSLLACGAEVTIVAPELSAPMAALSPRTIERRPYRKGDVIGFQLVVTATGIATVDGAVAADADDAGIWVNSADDPEHCSFILPSVHRDGPVTVAVSTGGASPALATWLRGKVGEVLGPLDALVALVTEARRGVRDSGRPTEDVDWSALFNGPFPELVRQGRTDEARALIAQATGAPPSPA